VAVLAEEGGPVHELAGRGVLHRPADHGGLAVARGALRIEQTARPPRRHDHVILDDGDHVARGRVEGDLAHARDRRAPRHVDHADGGEAAAHLAPYVVAKAVHDEHLERDIAPLRLQRLETAGEVAHSIHRGDHHRERRALRRRSGGHDARAPLPSPAKRPCSAK
jgi:hypothetical protein